MVSVFYSHTHLSAPLKHIEVLTDARMEVGVIGGVIAYPRNKSIRFVDFDSGFWCERKIHENKDGRMFFTPRQRGRHFVDAMVVPVTWVPAQVVNVKEYRTMFERGSTCLPK